MFIATILLSYVNCTHAVKMSFSMKLQGRLGDCQGGLKYEWSSLESTIKPVMSVCSVNTLS